jgi:hypothetical protein
MAVVAALHSVGWNWQATDPCSRPMLGCLQPGSAHLTASGLVAIRRGITAVVPVTTPNDTSEPQLLCMSPEQVRSRGMRARLQKPLCACMKGGACCLLKRQDEGVGCVCVVCVCVWGGGGS